MISCLPRWPFYQQFQDNFVIDKEVSNINKQHRNKLHATNATMRESISEHLEITQPRISISVVTKN